MKSYWDTSQLIILFKLKSVFKINTTCFCSCLFDSARAIKLKATMATFRAFQTSRHCPLLSVLLAGGTNVHVCVRVQHKVVSFHVQVVGFPYCRFAPEPFTVSEWTCSFPSAMCTLLSLWEQQAGNRHTSVLRPQGNCCWTMH